VGFPAIRALFEHWLSCRHRTDSLVGGCRYRCALAKALALIEGPGCTPSRSSSNWHWTARLGLSGTSRRD